MSFLSLENISHYYFSKKDFTKALDNISFSIKEGEFVSLVGPSGCGKSTILSIVAGIIQQTSGNVLLNKKPLKRSELAIGYMLQQDYLFPWKTILDNVLLGPKIHNNKSEEVKNKATELLYEVGLANVADAYPNALSGGMRQRVALVRTLITDPKVLLLDEPFSALDYQTKLKLEDLVYQILKTYHKSAILVTHDIGEAIAMSDRIYVMDANPGTIAKTFEVPIEIRNEMPFTSRRHPKYQNLFDKVWEELNQNDTATPI
ncbi:NitT/TauT family transport system ATP-binding protein [Oceanobacillus limi]|uniref:NitT/TauT family transport system ATP-binding protein n=1 Tax=Oceanobacillus limi TaxID=930131 RepID=A0A1I0DLT0_9BACI|nr:ABC transporter ATP-binding protein [Oceanobacillus limi]SET33067.1 NitT/TauT family transport system ATP-binding protein [Oceanobacillus limi]